MGYSAPQAYQNQGNKKKKKDRSRARTEEIAKGNQANNECIEPHFR